MAISGVCWSTGGQGIDALVAGLMALLARRPVNVATVALAKKIARVIWVVLVRSQVYRTAA